MATTYYYDDLAEIWSDGSKGGGAGPTGRFAHVLRGQLQDHGGNVLHEGTAEEVREQAGAYRIPVRLVPTEWTDVGEDVDGPGCLWQMVLAR